MKIAQISPLMESVPPKGYGGTERIVSYLTEELVRQGHEVLLFASADSLTSAQLVPCATAALRLAGVRDSLPHHVLQLERVRRLAGDADILHFHCDFLHFPLMRAMGLATLTTMHGRLDLPDYRPLFAECRDMPLVSISDHQRLPLHGNWVATVPHGLPRDLLSLSDAGRGGYLAFLGRICPEKRPDRAVEIARAAGYDLKIAAKVDPVDHAYFDTVVRPLLADPHVEFLGEIGDDRKQEFLGGARALLFPIDWPEPFGLTMIEAMACGTPVVAWRCGSVPEVVDEGVTGFVVDSVAQAVAAVGRVDSLSRSAVRARFEQRFTAERMARDYVNLYAALAAPQLVASTPVVADRLEVGGDGRSTHQPVRLDPWPPVAPTGEEASA